MWLASTLLSPITLTSVSRNAGRRRGRGNREGTLDDKRTTNAYVALTGEAETLCPAMLEDPTGRQFFICPVSNSVGQTKEQGLAEAKGTAAYMKRGT